jgi:O-acetylserine/cysteine efflux transporter
MTAEPAGDARSRQGFEPAHLALLIFIQVVWGVNWVTSKLAVDEIPPLLLMALRMGLTFALVWPFLRWHAGQMRNLILGCILGGPFSFATGFAAMAVAKDLAPLAIAANLGVPFATLLSALFLGDRIGIWRGSALLLAFGGVLFMGFDPKVFSSGDALALQAISALFWAGSTIYLRRVRGVGAYDIQAWLALCTWPPMLITALAFERAPAAVLSQASWTAWGALAMMVFGATLIGHSGFFWLLRRYPIPLLAPFMLLAPIIGAVAGAWWFGHPLTWRVVLGGALTLLGVLIITIREGRKRAAARA